MYEGIITITYFQVHQLIETEFRQIASHYLRRFPLMVTLAQEIISKTCFEANKECKVALTQYMEMEDMIFEQVRSRNKNIRSGFPVAKSLKKKKRWTPHIFLHRGPKKAVEHDSDIHFVLT